MGDGQPYHREVAHNINGGYRFGVTGGFLAGVLYAALTATGVGVAAFATSAFLIAGATVGGAVLGALGGMAYGAIRHSPLFERRTGDAELRADHAVLKQAGTSHGYAAAPLRTDHAQSELRRRTEPHATAASVHHRV